MPEKGKVIIKSNRYLIVASAIGIVAIVAMMLLYRQFALTSLLDNETRSNVALTKVMSNVVWGRYKNLLNSHVAGLNETQEKHQHLPVIQLDSEVKRLMEGSKLVKVKIYNLEGLTIYSSDQSQIYEDKSDNPGYLSARDGTAVSNITFREEFDTFEGKQSDINVVSSYIPVGNQPDGGPEAVFEVYSDVTDLLHEMERLQWQIVIRVLGSVAILYALLLANSRRVERIEANRRQEAKHSEAQIRYQAYHNPVTDLPNRVSFTEILHQAFETAQRNNTQLAVIFIDIDRFKLVNDSFGHASGDELLRLITNRLCNSMRQNDRLFHMGGDEFTVLLEDIDSPDIAAGFAKRMIESMKKPFFINNQAIVTTLSFGISIYDDDTEPTVLVKNAEAAMYLVKEGGGNRYQFYTPELNEHAQTRLAFESALQQALGNNEFVLHFQPRLSAGEETVVGFEALVRWRHPDGQLIPPAEFIPVLENTGLISEVGKWVLLEACSQCKSWEKEGFDPVRISVNVSPRQLHQTDFVEVIENVLEQTGLDAGYLELELTESALLDDPNHAIATMETLRTMGVTLSMDDFGTGYSSFNYLKNLPVDFLKIDRSFVHEIVENRKDAAIVSAIASVAHNLDIGLVAEGVESSQQARKLILTGCHELQGFLYSKPVPAAEAVKWLPAKKVIKNSQLKKSSLKSRTQTPSYEAEVTV